VAPARMEPVPQSSRSTSSRSGRILWTAQRRRAVETFLDSHYVGQKRFSLEGGRMLIPLLDASSIGRAASAWRGSCWGCPTAAGSNVLAKSSISRSAYLQPSSRGTCPSRWPATRREIPPSASRPTTSRPSANNVHLSLTPNPATWRPVNPWSQGRVAGQSNAASRTRPQARHPDPDPRRRRLCTATGLVARDASTSRTAGFTRGRHDPHRRQQPDRLHHRPIDGRSTRYCTDVARMIEVPISSSTRGPRGGRLRGELAHRLPRDVSAGLGSTCLLPPHGPTRGTSQPSPSRSCTRRSATGRQSGSTTESLIMSGDLAVDEAEERSPRSSREAPGVYDEGTAAVAPALFVSRLAAHWNGLTPRSRSKAVETGVAAKLSNLITQRRPPSPRGSTAKHELDRILAARVKRRGRGRSTAVGSPRRARLGRSCWSRRPFAP